MDCLTVSVPKIPPSKTLDCIQILVIRLKLRGCVKTLATQRDVSIVLDSLTSEQKSRSHYVVFLGTAFLDSLIKREHSGAESLNLIKLLLFICPFT